LRIALDSFATSASAGHIGDLTQLVIGDLVSVLDQLLERASCRPEQVCAMGGGKGEDSSDGVDEV